MHYKSLIATGLLAAGVVAETGALGDAAVIHDNPQGKTYVADFDCEAAKGSIYFTATKSGKGVDVEVNIEAVKGYTGPFGYHIHDQPVAADGNCSSTKAHLDPYQRGQATPCDKAHPETCEVGDLAGKHGKIEGLPYMKEYVELYASTKEGIGAFLGNRSIVIHANDEKKTRIACTNIVLVEMSDDEDEECESTTAPSYPAATAAYPGKPETPVYPAHNKPETPAYPGKPEAPAYPVHPAKPEGPAYPVHPEAPAYPAHPEHPESTPCSTSTPAYGHPAHPTKAPVYPVHPEEPEHSTPCTTSTDSLGHPVYPSEVPVHPSKPVYPAHPVKPEGPAYPVHPEAPVYPGKPETTLVPVYPVPTGYPAAPSNETSPYPPTYTKPVVPEQYTGSAATFGVSSFLAAVGAIAALVVVV